MKKIFLFTFFLATGLLTQAQDKTLSKNFKDIKTIRLSTASGNIMLKKGAGTDVNLTLKYSYQEDEFTPVIEADNGKLTLKEEFSRGSHSGHSSWVLEVPDHMSLSLNTGSGDVTLEGLNADVKSNLGSGNIGITDVKGDLDFNTGSGNIELNNTEGDISLNTGSGDIRATGGSGKYSFNAGSGIIKADRLKGVLSMNTGSGDIDAKNIALTAPGKFNTGSGDAMVSLASNLDYNVSVNSGSGDASLDFNGTPISGEVVMTANERSGDIVAPFKFDKEEIIKEGNSSPRIRKTAKLGNKDITIEVSTGTGTAGISK